MAMPIGDSADINTVLQWAMGKDMPYTEFPAGQEATDAARRLITKANKALSAGLRPEEVTLSSAATAEAHRRILINQEIERSRM